MAFERNNFEVAKKVALPKSELTVECNLAAGCNVAKILAVTAEACVHGKEVINGTVNYTGNIDTKVIFLTDENEINTIYNSCPFSSKFESEEISAGGVAAIKVEVMDFNSEILGGENLRVTAYLQQSGFVVSNNTVSSVRCEGDDVCYKNDDIEVIRFLGTACENVVNQSEVNLRDNIKKVLLTESKATVKNVESGVNFVSVSGEIVTRVLYLSENDKFESGYVYDTFKQEVELGGVNRDSLVEGEVSVCGEKVTTEIVQDERGGKFVVSVPVNVCVYAFSKEQISVVKDVYGTSCQINVVTESFNMTNVCPIELVEGKIEGSLVLEDDKPRVDKLLFNGGNSVTVTNSYLKDGEVFVEGIAKTTVVYLNDEDSSLHSVMLDIPFVLSDKTSCENEGILSVSAIVCDADVVVKKGREFYYDAKVKATVSCCCDLASGVITDAVKGEEYGEKDYAMEIVFASAGKELWDVAKSARVREEQIISQNPDIIFPVEKDTPLVLFYQRKA